MEVSSPDAVHTYNTTILTTSTKPHPIHPHHANPSSTVLIATDRMSPSSIGSEATPPITGTSLPRIRAFSDLAWISWAALAAQTQTDVKNMHYFMSLSISNKLTQRILSRCVREVLPGAWEFPAWPGFEFESGSEQGKAILGK